MTHEQFLHLSLQYPYEFRFYYGDVQYGILMEDFTTKKIYLIPVQRISEVNSNRSIITEIGTPVNITTIKSWMPLTNAGMHKKPRSYPLQNPPKIRKLIILGAGASYDCGVTDDALRPPVANELFQDKFINPFSLHYQGAFQLCSDLAHTGDIEAYFQRKWQRVVDHYDPNLLSRIINVQFYLHELFMDISHKCRNPRESNYKCLVNLANEHCISTGERVLFVNFNYDLLLEDALKRSLKYHFTGIDDYVDYHNRNLLLVKPHGSCDLIKKLDPGISEILPPHYEMRSVSTLAEFLYQQNRDLDYILGKQTGDYELLGRDEILRNTDTPELVTYLPQLLIPYKSKDSFVMPEKHEIWMDYFLNDIDEIIVIGWKGTEAKFQELLKRKLEHKKVTITTITKGEDTVRNEFNKSIPHGVYKEAENTFSAFIKKAVAENHSLFSS